MSLTRKKLRALGIEDEKIDEIIEAHGETVDALKAERDEYKAAADKLPDLQKELDGLKAKADDGYKQRYEDEHAAFEAYKTEQTEKETVSSKKQALTEMYKSLGIPEKRIPAIIKCTDLAGVELGKDGQLKDADKHRDSAKAEWADFIPEATVTGANPATPPASNPADKDPMLEGFDAE